MEESGGCCSGCGGGDAVEEVGAEAEDGGEARGHFVGRDWAIVSRESERESGNWLRFLLSWVFKRVSPVTK